MALYIDEFSQLPSNCFPFLTNLEDRTGTQNGMLDPTEIVRERENDEFLRGALEVAGKGATQE